MSVGTASWPAKAYRLWLHEIKLLLPPTIYFFCAFNLIVFTTNLMTRSYFFALTNFLTATALALLVGKAVLVADKFRAIHRFQNAPLIKPILYRTMFYGLVVMLFRIVEQILHFAFYRDGFRRAFDEAVEELHLASLCGDPDLAVHHLPDLRHRGRGFQGARTGQAQAADVLSAPR